VVEGGTGAVLGHRLLEQAADPDLVIDLLLATMGEPAIGSPRRPRILQTDAEQILPALKELAQQIDLQIEQVPDLPELSYVINSFEEFINLKPGLYLESEGADPESIRGFFAASAEFYRSACWKKISDIEPITLVWGDGEDAQYAVVMGNGNIVRGLALYDDAEDLEELYEDDSIDPSELACTSVVFVDKEDISEEQLAEIESNGWEVASSKAYPLATRTDAMGPPRMPTLDQLQRLEAALAVVPEFVRTLPKRAKQRSPVEPRPCRLQLQNREIEICAGYGIFTLEEEDSVLGGED